MGCFHCGGTCPYCGNDPGGRDMIKELQKRVVALEAACAAKDEALREARWCAKQIDAALATTPDAAGREVTALRKVEEAARAIFRDITTPVEELVRGCLRDALDALDEARKGAGR